MKTFGTILLSFVVVSFSTEATLAKTTINFQNNNQQIIKAIAHKRTNVDLTSFTLENYSIEHQGSNTLNISVNYTTKENKKSAHIFQEQKLAHQLHQLIFNYPNETDFWEVMNCQLAKKLLARNHDLSSISITITVFPNQEFPYYRASTVTLNDKGNIEESWYFNFRSKSMELVGENLPIINVNYTYKSDIFSDRYPDFIPIYKQIEYFLANQTNEDKSWNLIHRKLLQMLLQENPQISSLSLELK